MTPNVVAVVLRIAAGLWFGALAGFLFLTTRTLFAALPSRHLAGAVVSVHLAWLDAMSLVLAPLCAFCVWWLARGGAPGWRLTLPVAAAVAAVASRFVVSPKLHALRAGMPSGVDALAATDPLRRAFGQWHGISFALLLVEVAAVAVLLATAGSPPQR